MSDCCSSSSEVPAATAVCPKNGIKGKSVERSTVEAILAASALSRVQNDNFYICMNPSCSVVYFGKDGLFEINELKVPAGFKENASPKTVCYCFNHTIESIEEEIRLSGKSTVVESITAEIKAGNCECETMNPKGKCCLGDVGRAVKKCKAKVMGK